MTDVKEDLERKAFEEWYCSSISESIGLERYPNGCYCNPEAENMYLSWCAAKSHATQSAWISVEDKLPELNKEVLVVWTDGVFGFATRIETKYHEERWNWETAALSETITHWQPLTEPPKAA